MIPPSYTIRNLVNHKITSALTVLGVTLVVFVFTAVLMLAHGLLETLVTTGADDNIVVIRKASQTEVTSIVSGEQADIVSTFPEIKQDSEGKAECTREMYAIISLAKRSEEGTSNIAVRGVTEKSLTLRPDVKIIEGRMFRPGTAEIIAGKSVARRFRGCEVGETVRFNARDWTVVGVFDAGGTGFDSEIWGDAEQMLQAFRRLGYSSVIFRLADGSRFDAVRDAIAADPRLTLEAKRETRFYADQSEALAKFITYLGTSISVIFSLGAIIGAMITMYASVASRTGEIGTLRALGFSRGAILVAFLVESLLLGLAGGLVGLAGASVMQAFSISTMNFQTFAEVAFSFALTPSIVAASLAFALAMGFVGGFLPAARAARLRIVDALRAA